MKGQGEGRVVLKKGREKGGGKKGEWRKGKRKKRKKGGKKRLFGKMVIWTVNGRGVATWGNESTHRKSPGNVTTVKSGWGLKEKIEKGKT